jgi:uncharacterized protein
VSIDAVVGRLRADLTSAMRERDRAAVTALRTALAAIANAEAPPADTASAPSGAGTGGASAGLVDHPRLELSVDDVERILRHEVADRRDTIDRIAGRGHDPEVDELQAEIAVLQRYLP